jgi:hypothetical protein
VKTVVPTRRADSVAVLDNVAIKVRVSVLDRMEWMGGKYL